MAWSVSSPGRPLDGLQKGGCSFPAKGKNGVDGGGSGAGAGGGGLHVMWLRHACRACGDIGYDGCGF